LTLVKLLLCYWPRNAQFLARSIGSYPSNFVLRLRQLQAKLEIHSTFSGMLLPQKEP